jgi:hypothetical protein
VIEPELSIVVPSVNGLGDLVGCLEALELQRDSARIDVIVVDRLGEQVRNAVRQRFPAVRILSALPDATIPQMRAQAFAAATAPSVAVIEDHVIVPPGWARALLDAQRDDSPVVGGSVENGATTRVVDWAAFLCEYSHCINPLAAGRVSWLTGNNIVYPRELLNRYRAVVEAGAWENKLHDAFRDDGVPLTCHPEIQVLHKKHYSVWEYLSQRYLYARSYAGVRFSEGTVARRLAYGLASLALPPVLLARTVQRVRAKHRHQKELVRSLPLLSLFVVAWAAGEFVGYLSGAGNSLSKVR